MMLCNSSTDGWSQSWVGGILSVIIWIWSESKMSLSCSWPSWLWQ